MICILCFKEEPWNEEFPPQNNFTRGWVSWFHLPISFRWALPTDIPTNSWLMNDYISPPKKTGEMFVPFKISPIYYTVTPKHPRVFFHGSGGFQLSILVKGIDNQTNVEDHERLVTRSSHTCSKFSKVFRWMTGWEIHQKKTAPKKKQKGEIKIHVLRFFLFEVIR